MASIQLGHQLKILIAQAFNLNRDKAKIYIEDMQDHLGFREKKLQKVIIMEGWVTNRESQKTLKIP